MTLLSRCSVYPYACLSNLRFWFDVCWALGTAEWLGLAWRAGSDFRVFSDDDFEG